MDAAGAAVKSTGLRIVVSRGRLDSPQEDRVRLLALTAIVVVLWGAGTLSAAPLGDADCNNRVDPTDSLTILQFIAAFTSSVPCPDAADVNLNGSIDPSDALLILQFSAGLLNSLPPIMATPTPTRLSPPPTPTSTPSPTLTAIEAEAFVRKWILNSERAALVREIGISSCTSAWLGTHWYVTCEGTAGGGCILCWSPFRISACFFEQTLLVVPAEDC